MKYTRKNINDLNRKTNKKRHRKTNKNKVIKRKNYTKKNRRGGNPLSWFFKKSNPKPTFDCNQYFEIKLKDIFLELNQLIEKQNVENKIKEYISKILYEKTFIESNSSSDYSDCFYGKNKYTKLDTYLNTLSLDEKTVKAIKVIFNFDFDANTIMMLLYKNQIIKSPRTVIVEETTLPEIVQEEEPTQFYSVEGDVSIIPNEYNISHLCPDSGFCISFGKENQIIKQYFDYFTNFNYALEPIKTIGEESLSGKVFKIDYEKESYTSSSILKTTRPIEDKKKNSIDNLYYEYLVGLFINELNRYYPCFLETYAIYSYESIFYKKKFLEESALDKKDLIYGLINISKQPQSKLLELSCKDQSNISILIQSISNPSSLESFETDDDFIFYDLIYVIAQIYITLYLLRNVFCHNDLHLNNILIYDLEDEYIEYIYHLEDGKVIRFKTSYIVKIIDYGRCYFFDYKNKITSRTILTNICKQPLCDDLDDDDKTKITCGYRKGYWYLNRTVKNFRPNSVVDFLPLQIIHKYFILSNVQDWPTNILIYKPYLNDLIRIIKKGRNTYEGKPDSYRTELNPNLKGIYYDLCDLLTETNDDLETNNGLNKMNEDRYRNKTKKGTLHIYCNSKNPMSRQMEFIEEPN